MAGPTETPEGYQAYYDEISDGCGCTELWEYMSRRRYDG